MINSPSAMLNEALGCILLLCTVGALFTKTWRPPQHLHNLGSVTSPKSEIPSISNLNSFYTSHAPSGCMTMPQSGQVNTCCMTCSIPSTLTGNTFIINLVNSCTLIAISGWDHFTKYNNSPTPLQYLV